MPEPISFRWLPSTSTSTPPPARSMKTGSPTPTPEETASVFLASSPWERGSGISVTSRLSWAISVSIKVGFMLPPRNVEHRLDCWRREGGLRSNDDLVRGAVRPECL